jgi:hypothetical protein
VKQLLGEGHFLQTHASKLANEVIKMYEHTYPSGMDCVWLASDRDGYVAAFITAGVGPIPSEILKSCYIPIDEIESKVCEMPRITEARLLVSVKIPDSFIDLAERGVFVYDWTDVNRTAREELKVYEQVAFPIQPIAIDILAQDLAALAKAVRFPDVVFAIDKAVNVQKNVKLP